MVAASDFNGSNGKLVVKRTFLEIVDSSPIAHCGLRLRASSDPQLFESCQALRRRCGSFSDEDGGPPGEPEAATDFPVEFELEGFSSDADSADTNPTTAGSSGQPQLPSGSQDNLDDEDAPEWHENVAWAAPTPGETCGEAGLPSSPELGQASPLELDSLPDLGLAQLVNENARLGMENALLRQQCEGALLSQVAGQAGGLALGAAPPGVWMMQDGGAEGPAMAIQAMPMPCGGDNWLFPMGVMVPKLVSMAPEPAARAEQPRSSRKQRSGISNKVLSCPASAQGLARPYSNMDGRQSNCRTTVMLRNLPNNYSRQMLLAMLDGEGFNGLYDFIYLPIDFKSGACLGYAFVNLVDASIVDGFWEHFQGFSEWVLPSRKVCGVSWSDPHQGFEAHVERYRNSPVMHDTVPDGYRPVIFQNGQRAVFPPPSKVPRAPRIRNQVDTNKAPPRRTAPGPVKLAC